MALSTATVTFDIADQLGNDFDPRRTKVWLTTNVPGDTVIDTAANRIRLGSGNVTLNADGTGSIVVWVPGADANPASWQTTIHVDYPDRNAGKGRGTKSFGPFTITGNADLADLVAEMPVQPEYAAAVFDLIQGYDDHGNVSGVLTLNPTIGTHVLDATGPLLVTIDDAPNGAIVTLLVTSGAENVTVDDVEATLTDGAFASFVRIRGVWVLASAGSGGEAPVTDTTPPSAITDLTAVGGEGELVLAWSASTEAESTAKYGWRIWKSSDLEPSTWTVRTTPGVTITDLEEGTYNAKVYAFSTGGATDPDFATGTVTPPPLVITDTFTGTNGTLLTAHTADTGDTWTKRGSGTGVITLDGSGKAAISGNTGTFGAYAVTAGVADATASVEVTYSTSVGDIEIGPGVRINGAGNSFIFLTKAPDLLLVQSISGGVGLIGPSRAIPLTVGDTVRLTLAVVGTTVTAKAQRLGDGQWLNTSGAWQAGETTAITATTTLTGTGDVGIVSAIGPAVLDNFQATA